ncbi:putative ribonuclease T(2) [Helianthus annuus]|nr:putative ribonuclease T(2) [Helianthus annuus]
MDIMVLNLELQEHWPTLASLGGDNLKFWRHEWGKCVICADSVFDEWGYFKAVLSQEKNKPSWCSREYRCRHNRFLKC